MILLVNAGRGRRLFTFYTIGYLSNVNSVVSASQIVPVERRTCKTISTCTLDKIAKLLKMLVEAIVGVGS